MRMDWNDADAETVGAAIGSRDQTLVGVVPVAFRRRGSIENCHAWILNPAVIGFAVIGFDTDMTGMNGAEMNFCRNLERFADLNVLPIRIADVNIEDRDLGP